MGIRGFIANARRNRNSDGDACPYAGSRRSASQAEGEAKGEENGSKTEEGCWKAEGQEARGEEGRAAESGGPDTEAQGAQEEEAEIVNF